MKSAIEQDPVFSPLDRFAERADAYGRLIVAVDSVKSRRLRAEGAQMLETLRRSISAEALPRAAPQSATVKPIR